MRSRSAWVRVSNRVKPSLVRRRCSARPTRPRCPARKMESSLSMRQPHLPFGVSFFKPLRHSPALIRPRKKHPALRQTGGAGVRRSGRRLTIRKTYKLFVDGKFIRSESGRWCRRRAMARSSPTTRALRERIFAMLSARRAKLRRSGQSRARVLRGQILYRAAEMLEMRRTELEGEIARDGKTEQTEGRRNAARRRATRPLRGLIDRFSQSSAR